MLHSCFGRLTVYPISFQRRFFLLFSSNSVSLRQSLTYPCPSLTRCIRPTPQFPKFSAISHRLCFYPVFNVSGLKCSGHKFLSVFLFISSTTTLIGEGNFAQIFLARTQWKEVTKTTVVGPGVREYTSLFRQRRRKCKRTRQTHKSHTTRDDYETNEYE